MDKLIEQIKTVDTPTVSNAIEQLEVRNRISGFCGSDLKCLTPEFGVLCGYAVTCEVESTSPDDKGGLTEVFSDLCQLVAAAPHPAVIVLSERGAHPEFSTHCGEVMATLFQRLGAVGLVSDASVRDINEVRKLGFYYFARGLVASHGSFKVVRNQVPVTVCGLQIEPGDLLHGDENGLLTIPKTKRDELLPAIEKIKKVETELLEWIKNKDFDVNKLSERLTH